MTPEGNRPRLERIKRRASIITKNLIHPLREKEKRETERQQVLGELYSRALTTLKNGDPKFIPAEEYEYNNVLMVYYETPAPTWQRIVISTTDVSYTGVLPEKPSEILIYYPALSRFANKRLRISMTEQGQYNLERIHLDGNKDIEFKPTTPEVRRIKKELFDELLPTATRSYRDPYPATI